MHHLFNRVSYNVAHCLNSTFLTHSVYSTESLFFGHGIPLRLEYVGPRSGSQVQAVSRQVNFNRSKRIYQTHPKPATEMLASMTRISGESRNWVIAFLLSVFVNLPSSLVKPRLTAVKAGGIRSRVDVQDEKTTLQEISHASGTRTNGAPFCTRVVIDKIIDKTLDFGGQKEDGRASQGPVRRADV